MRTRAWLDMISYCDAAPVYAAKNKNKTPSLRHLFKIRGYSCLGSSDSILEVTGSALVFGVCG